MLLEYSGVKYKFVGHKSGPAPFYDKKEWMARKNEILDDFDFPNLPYYRLDFKGKSESNRLFIHFNHFSSYCF